MVNYLFANYTPKCLGLHMNHDYFDTYMALKNFVAFGSVVALWNTYMLF